NSRTDVGTQEVTATVSGDNYEMMRLQAGVTTIEATITDVTLEDGSFVYDGTVKSLEVEGTLPEGVTVEYTDNSRTDVGTQEVTAIGRAASRETVKLWAGAGTAEATMRRVGP